MGSFKVKLVAYFALIALLPIGVAFYGLDTWSKRREAQRVDHRLQSDVRFARAYYRQQLEVDERHAQPVQLADVLARAAVPLQSRDSLLAIRDKAILGDPHVAFTLVPGTAGAVVVHGRHYRSYLAAAAVAVPGSSAAVRFAALAPQHELDTAVSAASWKIAFGLLGAALFLGGLTYLLGLSIVRSLGRLVRGADAIAGGDLHARVEIRGRDELAQVAEAFNRMAAQLELRVAELDDERRRARDGTARFAEVLAATHDVDQLLRVVVETAVEVTGASGGVVIGPDGELARVGEAEGEAKLEVPLTAGRQHFGSVVLTGESFDDSRVEDVVSLAAHAVVALENARLHRVVERQARVDDLTGLENRRAIEERLHTEIARAERYKGELCLVIADLDDFKEINDRYGHPFGDLVLCAVAETLAETMRDIDTAARWGGEEFVVVLPGTDEAGGIAVAERARQAIAARVIAAPDGNRVSLSASFGVAAFPASRDLASMIALADEALYRAKRGGKNQVGTPVGSVPR